MDIDPNIHLDGKGQDLAATIVSRSLSYIIPSACKMDVFGLIRRAADTEDNPFDKDWNQHLREDGILAGRIADEPHAGVGPVPFLIVAHMKGAGADLIGYMQDINDYKLQLELLPSQIDLAARVYSGTAWHVGRVRPILSRTLEIAEHGMVPHDLVLTRMALERHEAGCTLIISIFRELRNRLTLTIADDPDSELYDYISTQLRGCIEHVSNYYIDTGGALMGYLFCDDILSRDGMQRLEPDDAKRERLRYLVSNRKLGDLFIEAYKYRPWKYGLFDDTHADADSTDGLADFVNWLADDLAEIAYGETPLEDIPLYYRLPVKLLRDSIGRGVPVRRLWRSVCCL